MNSDEMNSNEMNSNEMNSNEMNNFVSANNNKKSNKALNRVTNKTSGVKKTLKNTTNKIREKVSNTIEPGKRIIDYSVSDINRIFGGLLVLPEFASEPPMKECDGEDGYQKRYDELMEESIKQADEMSNDYTDVGSFFTVSPLEENIFLKRQIKVDCVPVEPTIEPNSKDKDELCWNTAECKTGLKCNNTEKYIKGVCEEGGVKKLNTEKGGNCSSKVECKEGLVCSGNYVKKLMGNGICSETDEESENSNTIPEQAGFEGES